MEGEHSMSSRQFAIVALLVTILGIAFASFVVDPARPTGIAAGPEAPCALRQGWVCAGHSGKTP